MLEEGEFVPHRGEFKMSMTRDKLLRNFGANVPEKPKPTPKTTPKTTAPKPASKSPTAKAKKEKPWWKFWRQGGYIKNYARGGGVRPASNEYK